MNSGLKLVSFVFGPVVFSVVLLLTVCWAVNSIRDSSAEGKKLSLFSLDADKGLAEQGYLWISILTPVVYFFVFGCVAWEGYSPELSAQGFAEFLKISTLPIGLLSLAIPLTILVSRIHATHQTSKQIEITRHKNNLDSYYAHRKAMFEYFDKINSIKYPGDIEGVFNINPRLHLRFFVDKGPSKGTPEVNGGMFDKALVTIAEIQSHIHEALQSEGDLDERIEDYADACTKIYHLAGVLGLSAIYEDLKGESDYESICRDANASKFEDLNFWCVGTSTDQLVGSYRYLRSFLRALCEFAGQDVSFFDQKKYPLIDKGKDYKSSSGYDVLDISFYMTLARDASLQQLLVRRKSAQVLVEQND
jgi:hypothetical protein